MRRIDRDIAGEVVGDAGSGTVDHGSEQRGTAGACGGRIPGFESPEVIWHATMTSKGTDEAWCRNWSEWQSLGKPGGQLVSGIRPAVGVNADGRLEVAVVGTEVFQRLAAARRCVVGLVSLETPPASGSGLGGTTLASNEDGRLELFVLAGDGAVWHRWQKVPNGGWSSWDSLEYAVLIRCERLTHARAGDRLQSRRSAGAVRAGFQRGRVAPLADRTGRRPLGGVGVAGQGEAR